MMLKMKLPGGSKRGRRHKKFIDIKEGMQKAGVTKEEDAAIE